MKTSFHDVFIVKVHTFFIKFGESPLVMTLLGAHIISFEQKNYINYNAKEQTDD